jgi:alpha-beta hydrolase superfamily lysophospholipase
MRKSVALLAHAAVLLAAFRWTYSAGGFLVTGLGLALLLDRYALGLLPWAPLAWKREGCLRAGSFLAGAAAFYLLRPGIVPLWEAAHHGLVVCLVVLLVDVAAERVRRRWAGLGLRAVLTALLALLSPLVIGLHPLHTVPKRTPLAFGFPFEDVRFRTADGLELAGWLIPHPHPRGNVIFCHGHGRNRGHVAGLLQTFHGLGLNVLAFDFRGHGDSPGHTSTFGQREAQDLIAAETYLRRRFPRQPVVLVGISLGAAVSLQALPELPRVKGVWSEGAFARLGDAVDNQFAWVPASVRGAVVGLYSRLGWLDCGLWGPAVAPLDRLRGVRVPVFFCHAQEDRLVPFSQGQLLYESYAGPKGHWWVAGASHYDVRQRHREEYLRRLRSFLDGCLKEAARPPAPSCGTEGARRAGT